ncbi:MAG: addiction module protein [Nitrospirae bacterium]|nr:addiction module protein [Nitrospirota bacterium]
MNTNELFDKAISLPIEIRMQLVEKLLLSLNPSQKEIDKLWAKEAEKRFEEIRSGKLKNNIRRKSIYHCCDVA